MCESLIISDYNNITLELCFKLKVWALQRKFYNFTVRYAQSIQYGEICNNKLEKLKMFRRELLLLNRYDTRDISTDTTNYNVFTYTQMKKIITNLSNL